MICDQEGGNVLVIRDAQMKVLREDAYSAFRLRLSQHIAFHVSEATGQVEQILDRVLRDCAAYQIVRECDIARYAELLCARFRGLPTGRFSEKAEKILLTNGVPAEAKLRALEELPAWRATD
jgi:hypothetical protein